VEFVSEDGGKVPLLGKAGGDGEVDSSVALATLPGLGLVVLDFANGGRLQVFATADAMAMYTNMSGIRTAWMYTVARAVFNRCANMLSTHGCRW
jgi:hypothetical protein